MHATEVSAKVRMSVVKKVMTAGIRINGMTRRDVEKASRLGYSFFSSCLVFRLRAMVEDLTVRGKYREIDVAY